MVRLAIIGTGGMGNQHAERFSEIEGVKLVAGCDTDLERAKSFCDRHRIPNFYGNAAEMLDELDVDAVSVVTPDMMHAPLSLLAIEKGKHVLCEKPLATCYEDAARMRDAAQKAEVINMVNFSYRNSPALQKSAELVQSGALGVVRHVHAYYLQSWLAQDAWGHWKTTPAWLWRLSKRHGSKGVLGDIGVHILDFASMPLGAIASVRCTLKTFDKAESGKVGDYLLDANDSAVITAEFANGALGVIHASRWAYPHQNSLRLNLYGDEGAIELDLDRSVDELRINRIKNRRPGKWETLRCPRAPSIFERFVESIRSGRQDQPDFARGALIQSALDACELSDARDATVAVSEEGYREAGSTVAISSQVT